MDSFLSSRPYAVGADADFTAKISLDNLEPATRVLLSGQRCRETPGPIASFITAPAPNAEAKVSFCFSADSRETYGPFTVMNAVRAQRPDFFLHLGDTISTRIATARRTSSPNFGPSTAPIAKTFRANIAFATPAFTSYGTIMK